MAAGAAHRGSLGCSVNIMDAAPPPQGSCFPLQPPLLRFVTVLRNLKLLNRSTQKSSSISKPHLLPALNHQIHYIWHWPVCEGCPHQSHSLAHEELGCSPPLQDTCASKSLSGMAQEPHSSLTACSHPSHPKYASRGSETILLS